jgi:hypothetical protein
VQKWGDDEEDRKAGERIQPWWSRPSVNIDKFMRNNSLEPREGEEAELRSLTPYILGCRLNTGLFIWKQYVNSNAGQSQSLNL